MGVEESQQEQISGKPAGTAVNSADDGTAGWWRRHYQGSVAQDLVKGLGGVEFGDWIIVFGASILLSVLPLIILLGALANTRVDDNIATRLG